MTDGQSARSTSAAGDAHPCRIFLLSPANTAGIRARMLFNLGATFDVAQRVRKAPGAPIGDVFSFLSGLYFRGKLAYANAFARPPRKAGGVHIITSSRGLVAPDTLVTLEDLREFASVPIDLDEPRYCEPLTRTARELAARTSKCDVVLLGSIATGKYCNIFLEVFGARLRFPGDFVGRGDMSRGGLMLRAVDAGRELEYIPIEGAIRKGHRPPKLAKRVPQENQG
jgi:hypothetical protein